MNALALREKAEKTFNSLMKGRRPYEAAWKRYRKAFAPHRGHFHKDDGKATRTRFRRNSRPFMVPMEFAAGMKGGLTNPSTPWFNLTVFDREAQDNEDVKIWLGNSRDIMLAAFLRTNIYDQLTDFFEEEGIFGTAAIFIDDDDEDIFRARVLTIGEYALGEDSKKRVNKFAITRNYTADQLVEDFGEDALPYSLRQMIKNDIVSGTDEFEVCYLIWPNPDYVPGVMGPRGMEYQCLRWLKGDSDADRPFLKIGGYNEFPVMVARWKVMGDDAYGRGHPGEIAIDDAETIQKMETASREAIQKMVDPPLLADERLQNGGLDIRSGGITWFEQLNNLPAPQALPLFPMAFDFQGCEAKIEGLKSDINRAFYVDLFRMWSEDMRRHRTATEVTTREQEKMYVLSPVIERQMSELLDPLIARIYAIMYRRGYFGDVPEQIVQSSFKVEYSSILANLAKQSAMAGIDAVVTRIATLAQIQSVTGERPSVLDVIDMDEAVQKTADGYNVPVGIVYGDDKLAEIRAAKEREMAERAQQQQLMAMAQTAPNVANAAKGMSETPVGDTNALDAVLSALDMGGNEQNGVGSPL